MHRLTATIENHIVILGWSDRVKRIIHELRDERNFRSEDLRPILVVAPDKDVQLEPGFEMVYFIYGSTNDLSVLRRANIDRAHVVLIPTVVSDMTAIDGQSVFSLLAALSVNPSVRICVEVAGSANGRALDEIRKRKLMGNLVEIVSFESISERLLAQAAINTGITKVFDHLLSFSDTSEVYVSPVTSRWSKKTFRELAAFAFDRDAMLIGYEREGDLHINPRERDTELVDGDKVWFIAYDKPAIDSIMGAEQA